MNDRWFAPVLGFLLVLAGGCDSGNLSPSELPPADVVLSREFPSLRFEQPVAMVQAPGSTNWFVVEKGGRIWRFDDVPAVAQATLFADLRDRVEAGHSEAGLLGIAFHPDYAANGLLFLSYTGPGSPLVSFVSRFEVSANGERLDPGSERVLLSLPQPFGNHNGGHIAFGPDRMLYIGFGDGGSGGDPLNNGQDTGTLFGAILRIDVDGNTRYAIPPDNPLVGGGGRVELFAWGLRNPWRFSFDREEGTLWAGDVGQDAWEEIDIIRKGGNYGWNILEGNHCFGAANCDREGLTPPVAEYGHGEGCSVTGGYVYRGSALTGLLGHYIYGDFCSGRIWALAGQGAAPRLLTDSEAQIASFAESHDGELYLLDFAGGGIYRIRPAP